MKIGLSGRQIRVSDSLIFQYVAILQLFYKKFKNLPVVNENQ